MANEETMRYREFIENLQREEHRPAALNNIKNLLLHKPSGEVVDTLKNVGISTIFQCLNVEDKNHLDLTCEVLKLCFEKFNTGDVFKFYLGHMMFLLRHDKSCVRGLAVDEVYKCVVAGPEMLPIPDYIDVFVAVAQLVTDNDVGVFNKAILVTSHLPEAAYPKILEEMKIALDYSNSSKCNAYEVITNISKTSEDLLNLSGVHGYIDYMLSELQSTDVLYQMNILELLSRLAVTPHGIKYLVEHGALNRIADLIADLENNPLSSLLTPGYMKFFGSIAYLYPKEIFQKYPALLKSLFDGFSCNDQTILPVAFDTLGFIGTTIEGKLCLAALGSQYTQIVQKVCDLINNSSTDIKICALTCLASLIGYEKDPKAPKIGPIDHRVTLMTREWFRCLSARSEAMDILYGIVKNPFPEIRLAAFSLLDATCQHQWGIECVSRTPGFVEYLLDRTADYTKGSKDAKYEVIKKLSRSAIFDSNTIMKLTTYVEQGPYYSESQLQVAIEEGD